jgi:hypothetical protein
VPESDPAQLGKGAVVTKGAKRYQPPRVWVVRLDNYDPMAYDTWKGVRRILDNLHGGFRKLSIERFDADFETVRPAESTSARRMARAPQKKSKR